MSDDLFFIPLMIKACEQADPKAALEDAFRQIRQMGHQSRYRRGYCQFQMFMVVATRESSLLGGIPESVKGATILVTRDGRHVATTVLHSIPGSCSIGGLVPGSYTVALETGRLLWVGRLTERDLLWAKAFPGKDLDLAAKTGQISERCSKEVLLLDGELVLSIVPGVETGKMELETRAFGTS